MNRPYTAQSPYSLTPTERFGTYAGEPPVDELDYPDYDADYRSSYDTRYDADYDDTYDEYADEYADFEDDEARIDRRWMWVAGIAGIILFIAVGTTGVILGGGDSGSVTATGTSTAPSPSATATSAPRATAPAAPLVPSLPPETVTTVTPTAEVTPTAQPVVPPAQAAPPPPAPSPRTVTYRVTGNRQLIDLVTVIYTDAQGALRTDVNVALPWAKTVVLDPGVELSSVTATSVAGQLNCSITDASGALIAAQNNNTIITNCTK
ncbi:hypothetical protein [Mycolicibacterium holsaticum]|uniref:hypothetical protein n=1 Tax=Mycolicibacterium holsaticum TaxID=152142 RepID=UPI001C7CE6CD|nr:hypothetical protein [Mycolicibacterium holsaticum]MDA4107070.1 hypothetical protein [Mycolicibacterium holsaticum DSM 44478 = JCM 12374]QZA11288.1 hypothetical protein K3U96_18915 [Mycolicibacterium holsaticum DSM 44478 = JCM 12374]UNC11222.1 hypothetical protein H5U41_07905 [Mycolicibacterium holsaticum DSM 44478 = JCM 12374]